jgi:hypothetical protein
MDREDPDDARRRHRRRRTWPWFVAIVGAMLLAMAAAGWIVGGRQTPPTVVRAPPAATQAPVAALPPAPPRRIQVNSVAPADGYPLSEWRIENVSSGFIDSVTFAGTQIAPNMIGMLQDSDSVTLTGWAGDTDLGIPFRHVVFSLCDRVVGSAPVQLPRPDVAKQVHPNLTRPGWTATLLVDHLPRCAGARFSAWAVAPFGRILYPLSGSFEFPLTASHGLDPTIEPVTEKPFRPEEADAPTGLVAVEIKSGRANLRRCGDTACKVVGAVPRGKYAAVRLDARDQWSLIAVPRHGTGWVADSVAKITPAAP